MEKACIIGIGGESAGGKSTLSYRLREKLADYKVKVLHLDDYYREESERPKKRGLSDGKLYIDDNHPLALDRDRFHADVERAAKDWDIVILEGLFILWDEEIRPMLDLKIYVDCDPDERLARRIKRHMSFGQTLEEITDRYIQAVQPRQKELVEPTKWKADIIFNGFLMPPVGIEVIRAWIDKKISNRPS